MANAGVGELTFALAAIAATFTASVPLAGVAHAQRQPSAAEARRPWELHLGLGFGDAAGCDEDDPMEDCWIDGAVAAALGVGYRLHPHWAVGLEVGGWSFQVPDGWRGDLDEEAADVSVGMAYLSTYGRFYWYDERLWDPYFQLGVGVGDITGTADNDSARYEFAASGAVYHAGIGVDYIVHPNFRIGGQWLAALLVGSEICVDDGDTKECRPPEDDEDGEREGLALPWRLTLGGTFVWGTP